MVEYSRVPFHIQILKAANKYWNDTALTIAESDRALKFSDLYTKSYQFATALRNVGAKRGDIICVILPNCLEYPIVFLGAALIGCPISGLPPTVTDYELKHYLTVLNSKFIVVDSVTQDILKKNANRYTIISVSDNAIDSFNFDTLLADTEPNYEIADGLVTALDDILITPFSSGTSGLPKCVQLTHRNFNCATAILRRAVFDRLSTVGRRTTLAFLPFYHGSGFWALCFCLLDGHHSVVLPKFQPSVMLKCIQQYKVDTINVVPAIINYMSQNYVDIQRYDLASLNTVLCGSAPLTKAAIEQFLKLFPNVKHLLQGYGMTEVVILSHITELDDSKSLHHLGSCGKLLPGFDAKILDVETNAEIKTAGCPGELCLKSDAVMKGYYKDPAATAAAIDADGWLHTGDVLYRDEDGFYFVVDRIKNLIKVNGSQVSASELEDILLKCPDVEDAAVVGIPNENSGQLPAAVIKLRVDPVDSESLIDSINKFVNDRVAPYKQLKGGIRIVKEIPKTLTNKTVHRKVLEIFLSE